jgi:hypothetical protein
MALCCKDFLSVCQIVFHEESYSAAIKEQKASVSILMLAETMNSRMRWDFLSWLALGLLALNYFELSFAETVNIFLALI